MKQIDFELLQHSWSQADAVLISAEILRHEPQLPGCFNPSSTAAGTRSPPLQVIVTRTGNIDREHPIFKLERCLIACDNQLTFEKLQQGRYKAKIYMFDDKTGNEFFPKLLCHLRTVMGVRALDVSAGGRVISQLLKARLVDEFRHSLAGQFVGGVNSQGKSRPTLLGDCFSCTSVNQTPKLEFVAVRVAKNILFSRSKIVYP